MQMPSTPPPARRRKGSQVKGATAGGQAASSHPDFSRILGYMGEEGEDIAAAELDVKPAVGKGAPREETPWEDVPDRDYIKHRTMKVGHCSLQMSLGMGMTQAPHHRCARNRC